MAEDSHWGRGEIIRKPGQSGNEQTKERSFGKGRVVFTVKGWQGPVQEDPDVDNDAQLLTP